MPKHNRIIQTVLCITDQEDLMSLILAMLDVRGSPASIIEATSVQQGIEMAKKAKPDVVLMDIGLHSLSGVDASKEMRRFNPKCQVMLLTLYPK